MISISMNENAELEVRDAMPEPDLTLMTTVYLILLRKGPAWTAEESPELERLQEAHLAHLAALRYSGDFLVVGPTLEGEAAGLRGIIVARAGSGEEARQLEAGDPAVQAGRFVLEVHPWMVEKAALADHEG